jgi:hypothetical protein
MSGEARRRGHARSDFFARRDSPQVWALDRSNGSRPFFLERGAADDPSVWAATYAGQLQCPLPGCPCPAFHTVRGGQRRDHFVHRYAPDVDHYGPEAWLAVSRALLAAWARDHLPEARVSEDERVHTNHVADLVIRSSTGAWAILLITEALTPTEALRRHREYHERGIIPIWLYSARSTTTITRAPDVLHEATTAQLKLGALGVPPRWFNPHTAEIATLRMLPLRDWDSHWFRAREVDIESLHGFGLDASGLARRAG